MKLDLFLFNIIHGLDGKSPVIIWLGIVWAKYALYALLFGALIWTIWYKPERRGRLRLFLVAFGTALVSRFIFTEIIRFLMPRARPYQLLGFDPLISEPLLNSNAFPSGHAAFLFAFATIFFLANRKSWWLYVVALLVGISRIFVGVHWPSDIVGGAILGLVIGFVTNSFSGKRLKAKEPAMSRG